MTGREPRFRNEFVFVFESFIVNLWPPRFPRSSGVCVRKMERGKSGFPLPAHLEGAHVVDPVRVGVTENTVASFKTAQGQPLSSDDGRIVRVDIEVELVGTRRPRSES